MASFASARMAGVLFVVASIALGTAPANAAGYFDAHNHISGILPYQAYANLPAFIASLVHPNERVSYDDRLALYRYLAEVWYPSKQASLDDKLFSPADGQRFALGARAALMVYRQEVAASAEALDGTLERVLSATPWSEFDSATRFEEGPPARIFAIVSTRGTTTV